MLFYISALHDFFTRKLKLENFPSSIKLVLTFPYLFPFPWLSFTFLSLLFLLLFAFLSLLSFSIHAQGLTAPPYLLSFFVLIAASFYSDKIADRSIFIISFSIVGGAGYLILALAKTTAVRYFAIYLCVFIFPVIGLILPWVSSIHSDDSSRGAGFMLLNIIGQCGPFLGTRIYPAAQGPYYVTGMAICSGFMFFAAALALLLRL